MTDTVRTIATILTTLIQDGQAAGSITPQRARDIVVSLLPPEVNLAYALNQTWTLDTVPTGYMDLTGNTTLTVAGGANGQSYSMRIKQDGTGGRTVTLAGVTVLGLGTFQTAANAVNILSILVSQSVRYAMVV